MKYALVIISILFIAGLLPSQSRVGMQGGGLLSSCPLSIPKELAACNVSNDPANPDGLYLSANGAPFFPVSKGGVGGVATFNNRSGNVLPAANDYKYSDLANKPTAFTCTTSSQSNTGLTASGCTFN